MKNTHSFSVKHKDNPQRDFLFFFVFLLHEKEEDTVGESKGEITIARKQKVSVNEVGKNSP